LEEGKHSYDLKRIEKCITFKSQTFVISHEIMHHLGGLPHSGGAVRVEVVHNGVAAVDRRAKAVEAVTGAGAEVAQAVAIALGQRVAAGPDRI